MFCEVVHVVRHIREVSEDVHDGENRLAATWSGSRVGIPQPLLRLQSGEGLRALLHDAIHQFSMRVNTPIGYRMNGRVVICAVKGDILQQIKRLL